MPEKYLNRAEYLGATEWVINEGRRIGFGKLGIEAEITNHLSGNRKNIFAKTIGDEPFILLSMRVKGEYKILLSCGWEIAEKLDKAKKVEFPEFHPKKYGQQLDLFSYKNTPKAISAETSSENGQVSLQNMQEYQLYTINCATEYQR
jgi:hypothetical protein